MNRIKKFFSGVTDPKNGFITSMALMILFVCVASTSYAFFTATAERKGALNIVSGNLYSFITSKDFDDEKQVVVANKSKKEITVTQTNVNGIESRLNFYFSSTSYNMNIGYTEENDACPTEDGMTLPKNGETGDTKVYKIIIENKEEIPITVTFGSNVGLANKDLEFPVDKRVVPKYDENGSQIIIGGATTLTEKTNDENLQYASASTDQKKEMFKFVHASTEQTETNTTTDYRYIGNTPNNYITFNDERAGWRIIGVFDVDNGKGKYEQRIKIMKDESIGDNAWDSTNVNNWTRPSSLMTNLNSGDYWGKLNETAKKQIEDAVWYLGGTDTSETSSDGFFTAERSTKVNGENSQNWTGKVGLMYPSDYMYTYGKGISPECTNSGYECDNISAKENGWMYNNSFSQWTITPFPGASTYAFYVRNTGFVNANDGYNNVNITIAVRPVVYLKYSVKLDGTGSKDDPYTIS